MAQPPFATQASNPIPHSPSMPAASTTAADATARSRIQAAVSSSSSAPLEGAAPSYDLIGRFRQAREYSKAGKFVDAREIFQEIVQHLTYNRIPPHSTFRALCNLECAATYPTQSEDQLFYAKTAKEDLDRIYQDRASWSHSNAERLLIYTALAKHYNMLLPMLLSSYTTTRQEIQRKIAACKKSLNTLSTYVLREAQELLSQKQIVKAREYFQLVQNSLIGALKGVDSLKFSFCLLGFAYSSDTPTEKDKWTAKAKVEIDRVYANRDRWNTLSTETKACTYQALKICLLQLKLLIPDTETQMHEEIAQRLQECTNYPSYRQKVLDGNEYLELGAFREAVCCFTEALVLLSEMQKLKGVDLLCRARCYLGLAFCNESERLSWTHKAKSELFAFFENRSSLDDSLSRLLELIPKTDTDAHLEIATKIRACLIPSGLPQPRSIAPARPPVDTPAPKKVTSGPVGQPWNWVPIFAVCSVAVVCVGLGLYHRLVVKK
jgi:tetratricopeptide (TPR) repeat protein